MGGSTSSKKYPAEDVTQGGRAGTGSNKRAEGSSGKEEEGGAKQMNGIGEKAQKQFSFNIEIGTWLDVKDYWVGKSKRERFEWRPAVVTEIRGGNREVVRVHFNGFQERFDENIDLLKTPGYGDSHQAVPRNPPPHTRACLHSRMHDACTTHARRVHDSCMMHTRSRPFPRPNRICISSHASHD